VYARRHYRRAAGVILVFDVSNKATFDHALSTWIQEVRVVRREWPTWIHNVIHVYSCKHTAVTTYSRLCTVQCSSGTKQIFLLESLKCSRTRLQIRLAWTFRCVWSSPLRLQLSYGCAWFYLHACAEGPTQSLMVVVHHNCAASNLPNDVCAGTDICEDWRWCGSSI
jgi:hypothetical protein